MELSLVPVKNDSRLNSIIYENCAWREFHLLFQLVELHVENSTLLHQGTLITLTQSEGALALKFLSLNLSELRRFRLIFAILSRENDCIVQKKI